MGEERRKHDRLDANLFVEFQTTELRDFIGRGVVVDVSVSGFAVDTETPLKIGSDVNCHIEVPLNVRATVVRQVSPGQMKRYGLKIKEQSMIDKFLLKKILRGSRKTKKV